MENISKKVVDFQSGKIVGYVLDYALDFQNFLQVGFFVVDEETEGEFLLRFENIKSVGDVIFVDGVSSLEFVSQRQKSLIGFEIFDENATSFGVVEKVEVERRKVLKVITDKCEILPRMIKFVGDDCVFLKGKQNRKKRKSVFDLSSDEIRVSIQSEKLEDFAPEKLNLSFRFFAGKMSTVDVFGYNNERIIAKNEIISKNIFEKAKKHNKLNELFFAVQK